MAVVYVTGGARSGKSTFAEGRVRGVGGHVTYVATARALDEEMVDRVRRHRERRPSEWTTVEEPIHLAGAVAGAAGTVLVDCLSLWVSNLMLADFGDERILDAADRFATTAAARDGIVVTVSNEVGSGIVPDNAMARRYRDVLGWVNQRVAQASTEAWLLASGLPVRLR